MLPSDLVTLAISANILLGLMSRTIGGKMPGGFNISSAKSHLSKTWGLGPQRADAVLLIATTMEPAKRLGSETEGKAWLDVLHKCMRNVWAFSFLWRRRQFRWRIFWWRCHE